MSTAGANNFNPLRGEVEKLRRELKAANDMIYKLRAIAGKIGILDTLENWDHFTQTLVSDLAVIETADLDAHNAIVSAARVDGIVKVDL